MDRWRSCRPLATHEVEDSSEPRPLHTPVGRGGSADGAPVGTLAVIAVGMLFAGVTLFAGVVSAAPTLISEEPGPTGFVKNAETELVREFIRYLFTPGTDLGVDSTNQEHWLTAALDAELDDAYRRCAEAAAAHPDERYDLPTNSNFYDAWDPPTTFRILGSRVYGSQAFVDVEYAWGANTNYPGDQRKISYVLVLVDGAWKLDDVISVRGEFASPGSLSASLRSMPE